MNKLVVGLDGEFIYNIYNFLVTDHLRLFEALNQQNIGVYEGVAVSKQIEAEAQKALNIFGVLPLFVDVPALLVVARIHLTEDLSEQLIDYLQLGCQRKLIEVRILLQNEKLSRFVVLFIIIIERLLAQVFERSSIAEAAVQLTIDRRHKQSVRGCLHHQRVHEIV